MRRKVVAIDGTVVKANKKHYYVYAAFGKLSDYKTIRVGSKPKFVVDKAPWSKRESLVKYEHQTFRED